MIENFIIKLCEVYQANNFYYIYERKNLLSKLISININRNKFSDNL